MKHQPSEWTRSFISIQRKWKNAGKSFPNITFLVSDGTKLYLFLKILKAQERSAREATV